MSRALDMGNRDVPRVARATHSLDVVIVEWALNETWSDESFHRLARRDVATILDTIQNTIADYSLVNLAGTFATNDQFGNRAETSMVWLTYARAMMDRINWSDQEFVDYLLQESVYEIADSTKFHPAFGAE